MRGARRTYVGLEDFVVFQTILDPSLEILHDYLSPSSGADADSVSTFHRFFRGFNTLPNNRILHRKQSANEPLGEGTMTALLN
jgi:hypothetical protein